MYITVLDFTDGRVYQYDAWEGALSHDDYEALLDLKGHKLNSIEWMLHENGEIIQKRHKK